MKKTIIITVLATVAMTFSVNAETISKNVHIETINKQCNFNSGEITAYPQNCESTTKSNCTWITETTTSIEQKPITLPTSSPTTEITTSEVSTEITTESKPTFEFTTEATTQNKPTFEFTTEVTTQTKPTFESTTEVTTNTISTFETTTEVTTTKPNIESSTETTTISQSNSNYSTQVLNLVNKHRRENGLKELTLNSNLSNVAQIKANDMKSNNYFSHTSPTYGSPFDMIKQFGISYKTAGENIAKGQKTPEAVVNAWMNSEGHRANILNSNYTQMGLGYTANGVVYWCQMFIG